MNVGQKVIIGGRTAEVVQVRKTAPVAVVRFDDGGTDLHWFGGEPTAPSDVHETGSYERVVEPPLHSPSKDSHSPETTGQAEWWMRARSWYERAGLCPRCSSQGAWGHQLGFSNVKPPCTPCGLIVAEFPVSALSGWRQLTQDTVPEYALTVAA